MTSLGPSVSSQVPGFTHPVHDVYLDEILPLIDYKPQGRFADRGTDTDTAGNLPLQILVRNQLDDAIFQAVVSDTIPPLETLMQARHCFLARLDKQWS